TNIIARGFIDCHAGLKALVSVTEGASEFEKVIQLYPGFVFPCFGIHPLQGSGQDLHSVKIQKYRADIVAVGERDEQIKVFIKQLEISKELDLPVNVHSRSAARVTIATMKELGIRQALLHNFAGKPSVAMEVVQAGFCFSFPPAVSKNEQRAKLIRQIPLEHICLETDSPALGIDKHVRNEPGNIMICCEYIAKVKGISSDTVMEVTTQNALRLLSKLKS
uniref:TatD DNase domain containing 3 n=1 Tax=Sinocyclocheilus anshuiensis TaxID=1608454 RepID=A0A671QF77_9TELE